MGIYISNMEIPKNGSCVQIVIDDDGEVYPSVEKCIFKIGSIAKAVPVPPHGRCIDTDALNYTMLYKENWMSGTGVEAPAVWKKDIDACPTIIPAEPEEEEMK